MKPDDNKFFVADMGVVVLLWMEREGADVAVVIVICGREGATNIGTTNIVGFQIISIHSRQIIGLQ